MLVYNIFKYIYYYVSVCFLFRPRLDANLTTQILHTPRGR